MVAMNKHNMPRVFVLEDNHKLRSQIMSMLSGDYDMSVFGDCDAVLDALYAAPPEAVIAEQDMVCKSNGGLLTEKRTRSELKKIPFIYLGDEDKSDLFNPDNDPRVDAYIKKPCSKNRLLDQLSNSLSRGVEEEWNELPSTQRSALQNTVREFQDISVAINSGQPLDIKSINESCKPLADAVQNQDYQKILEGVKGHHNYTYVHSLRVATYLSLFGYAIGIRGNDLQTMVTGGLVHDVGKLVVPQEILNKNGKLSGDEWIAMKQHVDNSKDLLDIAHGDTRPIRIIAEQHHEKLDGSGYPLGLISRQLDDLARMSTIVDIFGALTDRRSYKPAFPPEKAFSILEDMGGCIDQSLLKMFRQALNHD